MHVHDVAARKGSLVLSLELLEPLRRPAARSPGVQQQQQQQQQQDAGDAGLCSKLQAATHEWLGASGVASALTTGNLLTLQVRERPQCVYACFVCVCWCWCKHMFVLACDCVFVLARACVCACDWLWLPGCARSPVCVSAWTYVHVCSFVCHTYANMHACTPTSGPMHTDTHIQVHTHAHTQVHTHAHTHTHARTHTHKHTHARAHSYTHETHAHTDKDTHACVYRLCLGACAVRSV